MAFFITRFTVKRFRRRMNSYRLKKLPLRADLLTNAGKGYFHRKQVGVSSHPEVPSAGLGKAFRDGKPQAGAFGGTGSISPDKALGNILSKASQLIFRGVFDPHCRPGIIPVKADINPGTLQRVLQGIFNYILENTVQPLSISTDHHRIVG